MRPVKGQMLTLRGSPEQPVCDRIVASERVYLVPRPDGRLIVGATVEERGFDVQVTAGGVHELLREAYRALPDVAELELVETLAGPAARHARQRPADRARARWTAWCSPPATTGTASCWRPLTAEAVAALLARRPLPPAAEAVHPGRFAGESAPGWPSAPSGKEAPR